MKLVCIKTITLNTSFLTYVQSYWQEIQYDYRTLIGVEFGISDVDLTIRMIL